jgi:hypothetical protein
MVSPCPLAPGTSGQIAQYPPSGAGSMIAVNSPFIFSPLFLFDRTARLRSGYFMIRTATSFFEKPQFSCRLLQANDLQI